MFCLQDSSKDRPSDYKKSYLVEFYEQVAAENGFVDENGKPDVNIKNLRVRLEKIFLKKELL